MNIFFIKLNNFYKLNYMLKMKNSINGKSNFYDQILIRILDRWFLKYINFKFNFEYQF